MPNRSLTRAEAVRRAALLDVASYDIALELSGAGTFASRTTAVFGCSEPGAETFVELADALSWTATLNGVVVPAEHLTDNRIRLTGLAAHNVLEVEATLPCVTSGDGMHRYVDPSDGAVYVSAYCGMDLAQRVFACFDQPDLKATLALSVTAPDEWTVLSCGRETGRDGEVRRFATTPPLPTYLFTVCGGPWHSVTWEHAGLPFGWHARRSLAAALDRDAEELRRVTEACFDHYTTIFDEPFAFDSYDQVFGPGLNWGAMEFPGCVVYRDEMLRPGDLTDDDRMHRGMVVAHEMAHMWFGNLVTLRWWEDIWLNESFADYMGFEVAAVAAGFAGTWTGFTVSTELRGYVSDEHRSTHPVAAPPDSVVDTDAGFANADMITYAKGNAALRQLVTWLGQDTFLRGANAFLTRHRFGNAQLDDFLGALDEVSDRDVRPWADAWLSTTGFDTLVVRRDGDVPVLSRTGSRPHRLRVTGYATQEQRLVERATRMVDLAGDAVRLDGFEGLAVLPNASDATFARVRTESWPVLADLLSTIDDEQARAVLWGNALDLVGQAELDPLDLVAMASRHLPAEPAAALWEPVVSEVLQVTLVRHVAPVDLAAARATLAECFAEASRSSPGLRLAATRAFLECTDDTDLVERWLAEGRTAEGVTVDAALRWLALARLARLGAVDVHRLEAEAAADPSTEVETGAARARAALPTAEAKAAAWAVLAADDVGNRVFSAVAAGLWTPEHADLLAPYVERYLTEAPAWAARRGQGFTLAISHAFPRFAVTAATRDALTSALDRDDLPSLLRRYWNDRLDDLTLDLAVQAR